MFQFGQSNWVCFIAQDSRLLALPGEIRNQIYDLVLADVSERNELYLSREVFHQPPPLAQVCQQLRREFHGLFHSRRAPVGTICFKSVDCDSRHVVRQYDALNGFDYDWPDVNCIRLTLSFSKEGGLDWTLLAQLVDTCFATGRVGSNILTPNGWSDGYWKVAAVIGPRRRIIRHELVVDVEHTEVDCPCFKLAKEKLYFAADRVSSSVHEWFPNPRQLLKDEMESALRLSHNEWVIKKVEEKAAEKKRVKEAIGQLEVLMRKLEIE